jgi:hypothetical protein
MFFHHLTPQWGGWSLRFFERTGFERTTYPENEETNRMQKYGSFSITKGMKRNCDPNPTSGPTGFLKTSLMISLIQMNVKIIRLLEIS